MKPNIAIDADGESITVTVTQVPSLVLEVPRTYTVFAPCFAVSAVLSLIEYITENKIRLKDNRLFLVDEYYLFSSMETKKDGMMLHFERFIDDNVHVTIREEEDEDEDNDKVSPSVVLN